MLALTHPGLMLTSLRVGRRLQSAHRGCHILICGSSLHLRRAHSEVDEHTLFVESCAHNIAPIDLMTPACHDTTCLCVHPLDIPFGQHQVLRRRDSYSPASESDTQAPSKRPSTSARALCLKDRINPLPIILTRWESGLTNIPEL